MSSAFNNCSFSSFCFLASVKQIPYNSIQRYLYERCGGIGPGIYYGMMRARRLCIFAFSFAFTSVQMSQLWEEICLATTGAFQRDSVCTVSFFQHEKTEFPVTKTLQQQELLVKDFLLFSLLRHDPCLKDLEISPWYILFSNTHKVSADLDFVSFDNS